MGTILLISTHVLQSAFWTVLLCAICFLFPTINRRLQLARIPLLNGSRSSEEQRKAFLESAHKLYLEGYKRFKTAAWRIATSDGAQHIVIPPTLLPEVRALSDSTVAFYAAAEKVLETRYTNVLTDLSSVAHSVRAELTPALARLNPVVYLKVDEVLKEDIPECRDWTPISMYITVVTMVAKVTGRIFVGAELCRHPDYLDSAINYTKDVLHAQKEIKQIRPWLRPVLAPRLESVRRLRKRENMAKEFLEPVIQARREGKTEGAGSDPPDDMLSALLSRGAERGVVSTAELAKMQLGIIFAAVHTTSESMTHILYDLAVSPEYITPLREEIRAVMAEHGGTITTRALQQMMKLDSFMKESLRLHPPLSTTAHREVLKGFTFSNGQYIPPGATIEIPSRAIYQDPANYSNSTVFDGFRSFKLRQSGTARDHARNQFVTSNEQNLLFGYGRHACPGRFFAANEIKMLLARLILEFDFKNEDGSLQRYADKEIGALIAPDPTKKMMFKRVTA